MTSALPPPPPGTRAATAEDELRGAWWILWAQFTRLLTSRSTAGQRVLALCIFTVIGLSTYLLVRSPAFAALLGLALIAMAATLTLRRKLSSATRTRYVLVDGSASLAITATAHDWKIDDHSRAPGSKGAGARLRQLLIPTLLEVADRHDVAVILAAASPKLARLYNEEIPDLLDVGSALPYGRRMYRPRFSERRAIAANLRPGARDVY